MTTSASGPARARRAVAAAVALGGIVAACGGERDAVRHDSASTPVSTAVPPAAIGPPTSGETSTLPKARADAEGAFRLAGNEPFWSVRIGAAGLVYTTPDYPRGIVFPSTAPGSEGRVLRWVAITPPPNAHTLEVTLEPVPCGDTMADKTWTHTAVVIFDGTALKGCGERLVP